MNIRNLVKIKDKIIDGNSIVFTKKTRLWCQLPYPGHSGGCPNYNKCKLCPPYSPYMPNLKDKYDKFKLIYATFDFKKYKELRKQENSSLSEAQVRCILYWQSQIKKLLKEELNPHFSGIFNIDDLYLFGCGSGFSLKYQPEVFSMESVGIYVMKTLENNNISFELKPKNYVILVCLLCYKPTHGYIQKLL